MPKFKRIHLFEFEDLSWFPGWLRSCMTRYIVAFHNLINSSDDIAGLIDKLIQKTGKKTVYDLCSGGGGPMREVKKILEEKYGHKDVKFVLSDLYPNKPVARIINSEKDDSFTYQTEPLNAADVGRDKEGIRTMICSLHHMRPGTAKAILRDACDSRQPFLAFEISDNSAPKAIWWIAIPFSFLMVFFVTPFVRPMTFQQLFFTYIIPLLPLFIAWDGAVSNIRTYTLKDMDILLEDLQSEGYHWEKAVVKNKVKKLYLVGWPP